LNSIPPVLPLFPLPNAVLFPQMPLPLHVFEPRYRKMVVDVLGDHKTIGMTLLRPGWEAAYHGRPPVYSSGCAGLLEQCEALEDGRFNIVLKGISRFRIVEEHGGEPYRVASVEPLTDEPGDPSALEDARRRVVHAMARAADGPAVLVMQPELPHDVFVNALCQSLALTPVERQSLLDCNAILDRYLRLLEILDFKLLQETYGRKGRPTVH
jgi:Lon protease-like protein